MSHLDLIQEKASKVLYKLGRIVAATWGVRPEVRKVAYSVVSERIALYVPTIWYPFKVAHAEC